MSILVRDGRRLSPVRAALALLLIAALSLVCLATWRASARDREAFRSLVETLEEGVVMIDRGGTMVTANPSASRILGMDPTEVISGYGANGEWSFVDVDGRPLPLRETPLIITSMTGEPVRRASPLRCSMTSLGFSPWGNGSSTHLPVSGCWARPASINRETLPWLRIQTRSSVGR